MSPFTSRLIRLWTLALAGSALLLVSSTADAQAPTALTGLARAKAVRTLLGPSVHASVLETANGLPNETLTDIPEIAAMLQEYRAATVAMRHGDHGPLQKFHSDYHLADIAPELAAIGDGFLFQLLDLLDQRNLGKLQWLSVLEREGAGAAERMCDPASTGLALQLAALGAAGSGPRGTSPAWSGQDLFAHNGVARIDAYELSGGSGAHFANPQTGTYVVSGTASNWPEGTEFTTEVPWQTVGEIGVDVWGVEPGEYILVRLHDFRPAVGGEPLETDLNLVLGFSPDIQSPRVGGASERVRGFRGRTGDSRNSATEFFDVIAVFDDQGRLGHLNVSLERPDGPALRTDAAVFPFDLPEQLRLPAARTDPQ